MRNAVGVGDFQKIGVALQHRCRMALVVVNVLQLAHHAQTVVAHDDDFNGEVIAHDGGKLVHAHLEAAVAAHHHNVARRAGKLDAHGGGNGITHGAHAARRQKTTLADHKVVGAPNLVLSHVGNQDRLAAQHGTQLRHERARLHIAVKEGRLAEKALLPVFYGLLPLIGHHIVADFIEQHVNDIFHVAHNGNLGLDVFADFGGVDVDVDNGGVIAHLIGRGNRAVAQTRAADDNQIRVVQRTVRHGVAVGAEHTEVHLVVAGHNADSHHGGNHGDTGFVGKRLELQLDARGQHTAARDDERTPAVFDSLHRAPHLHGVTAGVGLVADYINTLRILKPLDLVGLNIHGDIDENRTLSSRGSDMERLLENARQILCLADDVAVLDKRLARARDVRLLKDVSAQQVASYLTGNGDHRNRIRIGGGNAGNQIGRAGARGGNANAGKAAAAGIAACRMRRVLLLTHQNVLNGRIIELVIERANRRAGVAEHNLNALRFQTSHHNLCAADHSVIPSFGILIHNP